MDYNAHMSDPLDPKFKPPPIESGAELLRRIGWHPSDMKQIELYARMSPAQKAEQMFYFRHLHVKSMRERLRREHPELSEGALAHLVLEHLAMLQEGLVHV